MEEDEKFEAWIKGLREDVIEGEFGYEPGEFTVYPEMWRGLFDEGLTPQEAFQRALDDYGRVQRERAEQERRNLERIKAEDREAITRYRASLTAAEPAKDGEG